MGTFLMLMEHGLAKFLIVMDFHVGVITAISPGIDITLNVQMVPSNRNGMTTGMSSVAALC
jgi:hypothetical protein